MVVGGKNQIKLTHLEKVDAKLTALHALKGLHNKFDNDIKMCREEKRCIQKRRNKKTKVVGKGKKKGAKTRGKKK